MDKKISDTISTIRFPLAIMVVSIHCWIINNTVLSVNVLSKILTDVAVPMFFAISGYLFYGKLNRWDWNEWKDKIRKRFWSIFIPYILWITIYAVFCNLPHEIKLLVQGHPLDVMDRIREIGGWHIYWDSEVSNIGSVDFWGNPATGYSPYLIPFWFIRNLMVVVLLSPLIYAICKNRVTAYLFGGAVSLLYLTGTSLVYPGLGISSLFFFGIGGYLRIKNVDICDNVSKLIRYIVPVGLLFLIAAIATYTSDPDICGFFRRLWILAEIVIVFYLFQQITEKYSNLSQRLCRLSDSTFFIFAIHGFIIPYIALLQELVISRFLGSCEFDKPLFWDNHPMLCLMTFLVRVVIACFMSYYLYRMCKRYMPKLTSVFVGR